MIDKSSIKVTLTLGNRKTFFKAIDEACTNSCIAGLGVDLAEYLLIEHGKEHPLDLLDSSQKLESKARKLLVRKKRIK